MPTFRDAPYLTVPQKRHIYQAWQNFLVHSFARRFFTKDLYKHLTLHCSFIAHFNLDGFYGTYFDPLGQATLRFIDQFDGALPGVSAEYGDTYWCRSGNDAVAPYYDLHDAMRTFMKSHADRLRGLVKKALLVQAEMDLKHAQARIDKLR